MENVELEIRKEDATVRTGDFYNESIVVKIYHFKNGDFTINSPKTKELAEKIVELLKQMEI